MANIKASIHDIRKSSKSAERNRTVRTRLKTLSKKSTATATERAANAAAAGAEFASALDKAAKRGIIHKNKASRLKSKIAKRLAAAK